MARASADTKPPGFEVIGSFTTEIDGAAVTYRKGEVVGPDDPALAIAPKHFRPLMFAHQRVTLETPEIRAD